MKVYNVHIIDRSNPDEIVCITQDGQHLTRVQDMERTLKKYNYWGGRSDIALVNLRADDYCEHCGRGGHDQEAVYPTKSGIPRGGAWDYLTDEQQRQCIEINRKIIEQVKTHPVMEWLLE